MNWIDTDINGLPVTVTFEYEPYEPPTYDVDAMPSPGQDESIEIYSVTVGIYDIYDIYDNLNLETIEQLKQDVLRHVKG